ncbi:adenylate/guanylate cyclase domain-containing protein [Rhizobiaceae bacterium n13]|uniref:Adenylate/guanylate cyclase domain-containing protein n=1 Tax=Ferirhizobium litorale TaxID=2927786 RepID=A0AAE3QDX0_9HYPH|nr:adenylate/guanylate cyclase domain-containing protein [Fererhizobium litorale]MDI7861600.1 adenylate/guanylate cyclase domain-containing protein [Fererhizobium litorale]MDI7922058.1 adenylate/guanylate cyclase domain-containing protein [Fererhizobium litorale]
MKEHWQGDSRDALLSWLMAGVREELGVEQIFLQLCNRLVACGIDLSRASLHFRVHHPQWLGTRIIWSRGQPALDVQTVAYEVEATDTFRKSPFQIVFTTGSEVRQDLRMCGPLRFALYEELRQEGHTDYTAWPIEHTQGKRHLVTFATDRASGFSDGEIALIREVLPLFSLVSEIRIKNQLARTLLQTYVGPHASEQILDGATTRGSGVSLNAAIMICDLRGFTRLSDRRSRDDVISILNQYFDAITGPIEKYGGEILKFIGDGLLAVFPLEQPEACENLLRAVSEAQDAIAASQLGHELRYGTGIHVGEVMYGNIGSQKRLDFTVIGPAVNLASRLENLTKELQRPVLISSEFVKRAGCADRTKCMGLHNLKGFEDAVEVHALCSPRRP